MLTREPETVVAVVDEDRLRRHLQLTSDARLTVVRATFWPQAARSVCVIRQSSESLLQSLRDGPPLAIAEDELTRAIARKELTARDIVFSAAVREVNFQARQALLGRVPSLDYAACRIAAAYGR